MTTEMCAASAMSRFHYGQPYRCAGVASDLVATLVNSEREIDADGLNTTVYASSVDKDSRLHAGL